MGATFTTPGQWQGKLSGGYEVATSVAGLPEPQEGYIYIRRRNVADRFRWGKGLTAWSSDAGSLIYGDDLTIINGPDDTQTGGEPQYLVTSNNIEAAPPGSGIWRETHVAERYTEWEEFQIPTELAP